MQYAGSDKDTIAAVATAPGQGGVGIVRISGPEARGIGDLMFRSALESFTGFKPYRLHHGWVLDEQNEPLDEVLAAFMPGPGSYTGEDVVEFNSHGGPAVVRAVLETALGHGARPAGPGEFTYRAFINGKLDLTQAEAVAEMIAAPTRAGVSLAGAKLSGALGEHVAGLRDKLELLRVQLCVAVDFPEEDVECLAPEEFLSGVAEVKDAIDALLASFERGRRWREGALAVLAGQVNAGKSSLMNALLGRERAIVTDIPGTTRDYIEEALELDGLPVRIVDTAGLRETVDTVELAGLERSRDLTAQADLVLLVIDRTRELSEDDRILAEANGPGKTLIVLNKTDQSGDVPEWFAGKGFEFVEISAKHGDGLGKLTACIRNRIVSGKGEPDHGELVPNLRQSQALERAVAELQELVIDIESGVPYDLTGVRLETACAIMSEITGDITPDEVLNAVFGKFCIGK